MNVLLEIIIDVINIFIPWPSTHENKSVVGESDLDRSARKFKIYIISILILAALGIWAWIH
jgi:accessory gene regulator protein AgrB